MGPPAKGKRRYTEDHENKASVASNLFHSLQSLILIAVNKAFLTPDGKYDVGNHYDYHEHKAKDVYVFHRLLSPYFTFHPLHYPSLLLRSVEIVIRAFKDCKVRKDLTGNGDIHHFV